MRYNFSELEKKVQADWTKKKVHAVKEEKSKPKRYVLDMFPYPSGYGLHPGHLLGYFGSDALAIFYRLQGFNVLHPIGFDAFGLPAEQYAIETGQHPAKTIEQNSAAYRAVLDRAGLTFDWKRSFSTTDPAYYRWTQWIFLRLFNSWYDHDQDKALPIDNLITRLDQEGNAHIRVIGDTPPHVTAEEWNGMSPKEQHQLIAYYRLAYLAETTVNWCPALGTVLANDEVKDGFSERGGHPVMQKKMQQWSLRMLPYAERLLEDLNKLDWFSSVKEMQRNWIGKSKGAEIIFTLEDRELPPIKVFTTRPDTLFGVTYLALAPEHPIVPQLLHHLRKRLPTQKGNILKDLERYIAETRHRAERSRLQEHQEVDGAFTYCYAHHPISGAKIPIWLADYVLANYGSGAIMAVPAHDKRDHAFSQHFQLPILPVIQTDEPLEEGKVYQGKAGKLVNSDFLNELTPAEAHQAIINHLQKSGQGKAHISYKLHDPVFSRQRYWGEPFPIYYKEGLPYALSSDQLPLLLPQIDRYKPNEDGEPPLSRAKGWATSEGDPLEYNTMPAWAGSSWYFLRYMDPHNSEEFVRREALDYWQQVDDYVGGAEHTTGHLLYARFFTKVLYDLGELPFDEPFQRLINQGMLQSTSAFVYRIKGTNQFVSYGLKDQHETVAMHVDIRFVKEKKLDTEAFKAWRPDLADATFILEEGSYICGEEVEKMSKSKHNVVDPQAIIDEYGADALRLHLLFLGPITQSKPWNTQGIEGVSRLLRKIWALFYDSKKGWIVTQDAPAPKAVEALHRAIKQITEDIGRSAFNTCISSLMILVNTLTELQAHQKEVLQPFLPLLAPFAPHMAEALWQKIGNTDTIFTASFPKYDPKYLVQRQVIYPIAINGKTRATLSLPADTSQEEVISAALAHPDIIKRLQGEQPKRTIVIPRRMINLVL